MKKIFTFSFLLLAVLTVTAQQNILNNSFENWIAKQNNTYNYEDPEEFSTSNPYMANFGQANVSKSTDAFVGSYSAELSNLNLTVLGVIVPGVLVYGQVGIGPNYTPTFGPGKPFTDRPDTISAHVKYDPDGVDTFGVVTMLTKWNNSTGERDTIAFQVYKSGSTLNTWTKVDIEVDYLLPDTPDTLLMVFLSTVLYETNAPPSSVLHVDNIRTSNMAPVGNKQPSQKMMIKVYPNPVRANLNFEIEGMAKPLTVNVYNMLGMLVESKRMEHDLLTVNVNSYKNGLYFYEIKALDDRTLRTGKFNVSK